jgi:hypothetical protein
MVLPNTKGRQTWKTVQKTIKLDAGQHVLKLVVDGRGFSIDKIVFN